MEMKQPKPNCTRMLQSPRSFLCGMKVESCSKSWKVEITKDIEAMDRTHELLRIAELLASCSVAR